MIEEQLMTLVLLFVFAIIGGIIAQKFKQPIVLGFLLIGTLIGPFALNLINNHEFIDLVIEFGAILLMFVVGLEFTPEQIKKVGVKGFILGIIKVGLSFFMGFMLTIIFGLGITDALFIGIVFSFTSTVIFVKILEQKDLIKRQEVPLMLTVLVVDDIVAVLALTMLTSASSSSGLPPVFILENMLIGIFALVLVYFFFQKFANNAINMLLQKNKNEELITFLSLALCAGLSYGAYMLGLSPTAGAFLAGSIVASVKDSKELGHAVMPHNLMFSSLFFLAVGTLINFKGLIENIWLVLFMLGAFMIVIFVSIGLTVYLFGNMRKQQPIFCALIMLPLGEFSLLIAKEAKLFNTSIDFVTLTAALIFLTTIIMSLLVTKSDQIYAFLENKRPGRFKIRLNSLGSYISGFLDQIDNENTFTNRFKKYASKMFMMLILTLFFLIGAHKLSQFMVKLNMPSFFIYGAVLFLCSIAVVFAYFAYKSGKETYRLSVNIISYTDKSMSVRRAKKSMRSLLIGMIVMYFGLISPGFLFIMQLPRIYVLIPVGIVLIGLFIMSRVFRLLSHFSNEYAGYVPEYKKYNPELVKFQKRRYD